MNNDILALGTILGIWAHPDDEVFTMAGLMAMACANGQRVVCVTATRGEAGVQDASRWPAEHLGQIRTDELVRAYDVLGDIEHYWLDYADGCCDSVDQADACMCLNQIIAEVSPDTVFTFSEDGLTGHMDHRVVSKWARQVCAGLDLPIYYGALTPQQLSAFEPADKELNFFFNIDKPDTCRASDCDIYLELTDEIYHKKLDALRAMPSQTEKLLKTFGDQLRPALGVEAFCKF